MDGEGGCLFVCALPLVSKSENAKEVLCALRGPLSASKSENAAKVCAFDASSSRAVAVLLTVWLYQPACVRAVLLTVWLTPAPQQKACLSRPCRVSTQLFATVECAIATPPS